MVNALHAGMQRAGQLQRAVERGGKAHKKQQQEFEQASKDTGSNLDAITLYNTQPFYQLLISSFLLCHTPCVGRPPQRTFESCNLFYIACVQVGTFSGQLGELRKAHNKLQQELEQAMLVNRRILMASTRILIRCS
jgi:hypothetical protein